MAETPGFTKILTEVKDVDDQLELCKKLLARLTNNSVRGVLLTIAEQPDPQTLTAEQLAELEAEGIKSEDATRVSHVLVGPLEMLVHLFKSTGVCIHQTYKQAQEQYEAEQAAAAAETANEPPPGTVLH